MATIYTDGKKHKEGSFFSREERDKEVDKLRFDGWFVKCGKHRDIDGSGEIFWYNASK